MKKLIVLNKEQERQLNVLFSFTMCLIGVTGFLYEGVLTYHPYNSLVPNFANIVSRKLLHCDILPDEPDMFMSDYYIKPIKGESMSQYINRVPSNLRLDNKMWSGWIFITAMFLPLYIISSLNLKVNKIDKNKVIRMIKEKYRKSLR